MLCLIRLFQKPKIFRTKEDKMAKVKFTIELAMKAQRKSRGVALLFH
jgi:hypothetical protein